MITTTARSPHLDNLRGRRDCVGACDTEYTSAWKIWSSTTTEMPSVASGKPCTNDLIPLAVVLDLPNALPKFFSGQRILCTLNGHSTDGESKNHVNIWTYYPQSAAYTG